MRNGLKLAAVAACCAVGVFAPSPNPDLRSALHLHDFLHVPAFAAIAVLLLAGDVQAGSLGRRVARVAWVFAACLFVGVLIELLQLVAGGDADPWDVLHDMAGTCATLLVAASCWPEVRRVGRWTLRGVAAVVVLAFAQPTLVALHDEWRARREFPVLADFSRPREMDRFEWQRLAPATRVCDSENASESSAPSSVRAVGCVARVPLFPGPYPGFTLRYFPRDWRGYQRFVLACTNPSADPLRINIRIDDMRHNNEYNDRFNGTYVLAPGRNEVRVALADVERAPRGRRLDLAQVRTVVVFAYRLEQRRELVVEGIRLE